MDLIDSYANEFLSKFQRISSIIKHGPSIGTYHENILRNFFSSFLTNRFSVKTGFVYNHQTDYVSQQIDIIIIDENVPCAYFFKDNDFAIVDSNAVVCGIEVKSNLTIDSFKDCCNKARDYYFASNKPNFFVFSFSATLSKKEETLTKWFNRIDQEDVFNYYPHGVYLLQNGILKLVADSQAKPWGMYFFKQLDEKKKIEEIVVNDFLATILKQCEFKSGINSGNPYKQYSIPNELGLHTTYRYKNVHKNEKTPFIFD